MKQRLFFFELRFFDCDKLIFLSFENLYLKNQNFEIISTNYFNFINSKKIIFFI